MMRNGIAYQLPPLARLTEETGCGLWRTPCAGDGERGVYASKDALDARLEKGGQLSLSNQVKHQYLWPTPVSMMWKDSGCPSEFNRNEIPLAALVGGALNPTWVEWLMGFPLGWTVSKVWEMRSSRKSQKSLVEQS